MSDSTHLRTAHNPIPQKNYLILNIFVITKETYPHMVQTDNASSWPIMAMVIKVESIPRFSQKTRPEVYSSDLVSVVQF